MVKFCLYPYHFTSACNPELGNFCYISLLIIVDVSSPDFISRKEKSLAIELQVRIMS